MNLQSQKVEGTIKDFLKKGALNLWQHQVVYLLPLLIFYPLIGLTGLMPSYVRNFFMFFIGIFFMFLYMEITFTTTQEKYTPKKYLTSIILSIYTTMSFLKRHIALVIIMLVSSVVISVVFNASSQAVTSPTFITMTKDFLRAIFRYSGTGALMDAFLIALISREVVSDYFVTQRISGLSTQIPENVTSYAMGQNVDILKSAAYIAFFFTTFSAIMLGIQGIVFIILTAALTFYSMEVFGVDTGKKQRQEETEKQRKEVDKLIPLPLN